MADDTRQAAKSQADDSPGIVAAGDSTSKLPKGVVLGPDGKPCRTCTSAASWKAMAKMSLNTSASPSGKPAARPSTSATEQPDNGCPPDVEQLGRSTWTLLHTMAATYPDRPSATQQSDLLGFVRLFAKLYPCWVCAEDFQAHMAREAPRVGSRNEFGMWLCEAHNEVNRKLGKKVFPCDRWLERWRDGWKDGRCD